MNDDTADLNLENKSLQKICKESEMNMDDIEELNKQRVDEPIEEVGLLWHKRLGHASLSYLLKMSKIIPELKKLNLQDLSLTVKLV